MGRYHVLYYNNDYERVRFRGIEMFRSHECYTREAGLSSRCRVVREVSSAPRAEGTEDESVVITPDKMWGDNAMDVEITETASNTASRATGRPRRPSSPTMRSSSP